METIKPKPPDNLTVEVERIWHSLQEIKDPEIPVISLVELGVVGGVEFQDGGRGRLCVTLIPTFSGCPALHVMQGDVTDKLKTLGYTDAEVRIALSPPWTTDRISESGRKKLLAYGLAPPARHGGLLQIAMDAEVPCPHCASLQTEIRNTFGPTPCRELRFCRSCQQPYEAIKPL